MSDIVKQTGFTLLAGRKPIANGAVRDVWDRPGHPDQILKTIRAHKRIKYAQRGVFGRAIDHFRLGPYGTFRIEAQCYLKTAYKCVRQNLPMPIAEIGGLVLTDRGLAQVGEKITNKKGALAETLDSILRRSGLDQQHLTWLNEFAHTLFEVNANVPDLRAVNVVLDEQNDRFVLIDGYGDKTLLPIRTWIKPLNQKNLSTQFEDMEKYGGLTWHSETKSFSI
ncbi:MAG: YrbL family protein [Sulfitobacter sp.]